MSLIIFGFWVFSIKALPPSTAPAKNKRLITIEAIVLVVVITQFITKLQRNSNWKWKKSLK